MTWSCTDCSFQTNWENEVSEHERNTNHRVEKKGTDDG